MSRPLVLLHPLGTDGGFWRPVLEHLGDETVLTPDLPGHGTAPAAAGPTLADLGRAVLADLDQAGLDRVDLVGLSIGGLVGQYLAATAPERVARLVLVDTVVTYPPEMRDMWRSRAAAVRAEGTAAFVEPTLALWFTAGFRAAGGPVVAAAAAGVVRSPAEGYARACDLLARVDTAELLAEIRCPTLVMCGDDDAPPLVAAARQLAGTLSDARVAWLPGRHAAAVENPAEFAAVLRGFRAEPLPSQTSTGGAS
jgi:3-oxoadipate enol-lactonase